MQITMTFKTLLSTKKVKLQLVIMRLLPYDIRDDYSELKIGYAIFLTFIL